MSVEIFLLLFIFQLGNSYKTHPTSYLCTESTNNTTQNLPSCLPGYIIDIENVFYESTIDNLCSGTTLCRVENKNTLLFACNRKRTCHVNTNTLRFHINSTCGSTIRLFTKYRCLPVIQEQTDYLCESSLARRVASGDINLSCERNYRLHITTALIGISMKSSDEQTRSGRFKCNKDTQTTCHSYVPNAYRDVCDNQLRQENGDECKIRYHERPALKDCPYGMTSNFSLVGYSCIPGDGIKEDLPRTDICAIDIPERLSINRGLLHSPNYPLALGQYLSCEKELYVPYQSRLRLFMLEKSIEYSHEFNIHLLNNIQTLAVNELFDINITKHQDEFVRFKLKTNHVGGGNFLLYFQVDSHLSEYAPFVFQPGRKSNDDINRQGKTSFKRQWGVAIGCIIGLLLAVLIIAAILAFIRISKQRRERCLKYLKNDDSHRDHLNASKTSPNDHLQIEQPYLASSAPAILPSTTNHGHNRPHSASSTTSSITIHQMNDGLSDRESLIKSASQIHSHPNTDIDNFYEEIKEQQQQTALALGTKGDILNPYLEAKCFEQKKPIFQGNPSSQPIRDHHENESRYQRPASSANEQIKRPKRPPPTIPSQRMDIQHSLPSAPPHHLIENDETKTHLDI